MPWPPRSCNSQRFPWASAERSTASSSSWCGKAATGRRELLHAPRPRLSSPYANSLCKKPRAQPLPGVEYHQHTQGRAALASLSQTPLAQWDFFCLPFTGLFAVQAPFLQFTQWLHPGPAGSGLPAPLLQPRAPACSSRCFLPSHLGPLEPAGCLSQPPFSQCCVTTPKMTRGE